MGAKEHREWARLTMEQIRREVTEEQQKLSSHIRSVCADASATASDAVRAELAQEVLRIDDQLQQLSAAEAQARHKEFARLEAQTQRSAEETKAALKVHEGFSESLDR